MKKETKISVDRLRELERIERKMRALDAGGVDSWDGYEDALSDYFEWLELEEKLETLVEEILCCAAENGRMNDPGLGVYFTDDAKESIAKMLKEYIDENFSVRNKEQ